MRNWWAAQDKELRAMEAKRQRPYFIWDYDISEDELRQMLTSDNEVERIWAISRIVQYARWEDIWKYLTVEDIRANFYCIYWRVPELRQLWAYALDVWGRSPDGDTDPAATRFYRGCIAGWSSRLSGWQDNSYRGGNPRDGVGR